MHASSLAQVSSRGTGMGGNQISKGQEGYLAGIKALRGVGAGWRCGRPFSRDSGVCYLRIKGDRGHVWTATAVEGLMGRYLLARSAWRRKAW